MSPLLPRRINPLVEPRGQRHAGRRCQALRFFAPVQSRAPCDRGVASLAGPDGAASLLWGCLFGSEDVHGSASLDARNDLAREANFNLCPGRLFAGGNDVFDLAAGQGDCVGVGHLALSVEDRTALSMGINVLQSNESSQSFLYCKEIYLSEQLKKERA